MWKNAGWGVPCTVKACTLGFPGSQVVHVNGHCALVAGCYGFCTTGIFFFKTGII